MLHRRERGVPYLSESTSHPLSRALVTGSPASKNTITITLQTNYPIEKGDTITITGLDLEYELRPASASFK